MYRVLYHFPGRRALSLRPAETQRKIISRLPAEIVTSTSGPRVLWRRESDARLHVQYPAQPRAEWLLPGASIKVTDMHPLLAQLAEHQVWDFNLSAHTVQRHGSREQAVPADEWLTGSHSGASRAYRSGFRVLRLSSSGTRRGTAGLARETRIRGLLQVEDPTALQAALEEGIGRGRAQGLGMLSLSRPSLPKGPAGAP
ncbi:type I-E CRISPR-associated protein Cas6/Cse3/CasE [Streptomyces bacillaris]|uniref:type I-E CRISPR-associated protein Cas6/Cse3/CasE n=1 Tax=Streptomyces bacillaris TaxID=68179 RepID=UPI00363265D7